MEKQLDFIKDELMILTELLKEFEKEDKSKNIEAYC